MGEGLIRIRLGQVRLIVWYATGVEGVFGLLGAWGRDSLIRVLVNEGAPLPEHLKGLGQVGSVDVVEVRRVVMVGDVGVGVHWLVQGHVWWGEEGMRS